MGSHCGLSLAFEKVWRISHWCLNIKFSRLLNTCFCQSWTVFSFQRLSMFNWLSCFVFPLSRWFWKESNILYSQLPSMKIRFFGSVLAFNRWFVSPKWDFFLLIFRPYCDHFLLAWSTLSMLGLRMKACSELCKEKTACFSLVVFLLSF